MKIALSYCPLIAWSLAAGLFLCRAGHGAIPTFENRTPAGFSLRDSTARQDFIEGQQVTVEASEDAAAGGWTASSVKVAESVPAAPAEAPATEPAQ